MSKLAGMEASATSVLRRAVELDGSSRLPEALVCYQEGIQLLLDVLKATTDETKKSRYRERIREYMDRAEEIKKHVQLEKEAGKYHEQIHIAAGSVGYSYDRLFRPYMDQTLTEIMNFLRFCELLVKSAGQVRRIHLTTGEEEGPRLEEQQGRLRELRDSLNKYSISLDVQYSATLHDREIRFSNGWIIKIGRGLDIFKPTKGPFQIGFCDYDLRECHETTVDIFHNKHLKTTTHGDVSS
ncbi:MIT domain-containing protein 1-like isoform X2 [Branchiostoma floridae]|uniref:MIT domain-containing protein 1-like isoform X2 n=1 Tax=Branchiostoma floridae TaxID=7739 RepID=A0A9J7LFR6_BRAFL|nr:MIT domain-containing protein 1-like isoform X2 [Branchiostoma floridae]